MPTTSNVVCGCGFFMRAKQNGVTVEELQGDGSSYRLWSADLYGCTNCEREVITGFGRAPLAEYHEKEYDAVKRLRAPIISVR